MPNSARTRASTQCARAGLLLTALVLASAAAHSRAKAETRPEPLLVAHRGLARHAPENTLPAYAACLSLRIGFETDVRRTSDGHLVVLHDATVDRTTGGKGAVTALSLDTLRNLDAGAWFHPSFRDERIPTLDEVFQLIAARGGETIPVAIDLKGEDPGIEGDIVALAKKRRVLPRLLFIGRAISLPEVRARLRAADRSARIARLAQVPDELRAALDDPSCDWAYLRFIPTRDQVTTAHAAGKRVFIAGPTVAEKQPYNWRAAATSGVDAFLTDEPLEARRAFKDIP